MELKKLQPPNSGSIANPDGTPVVLSFYNDLAKFRDQLFELLVAGVIDTINWEMTFVENGDYSLFLNSPYAFEINSVTTKSSSGTCTATVKINTTTLGGTANSVSSSEQTQAHTTNNSAAIGDDVILTISSNSSCERMKLSLKITRVLFP